MKAQGGKSQITMTREQLCGEYGSYHQDSRNRLCHAIGIPLIALGILELLAVVRLGPVDLAVLAAVAVLIYYCHDRSSWRPPLGPDLSDSSPNRNAFAVGG